MALPMGLRDMSGYQGNKCSFLALDRGDRTCAEADWCFHKPSAPFKSGDG